MPKELHIAPFAAVSLLLVNTTKPPFNDVRVRQALAMAINREQLVERITQAGELPAYGFVPAGIANYTPQKVSWSRMSQADRDGAAIKLMTDAGYGPKKPLNIRLNHPTSENRHRIAVAIAAMWKKLGVNVELVQTEIKVNSANLRQGDFEIGTFAGGAYYNDAREFLYAWQTSNQQNWARFSEQILLRELPLFFNVSKNLVSTRVKGCEDNLLNITYVKNLSLEK